MLALDDKWLWDSWFAHDGERHHAFYLQADKSIGDPELRHWNVSYGHATSLDLTHWDHLGRCFGPADGPAWDDYTTWTGSVVRSDNQWHLFYTGTSRADGGKGQRLGHAVSHDLHRWERVGDGLILDRDDRYEEYDPARWHDRAFRDPWVMPDPRGGWMMFFTGRTPGVDETNAAGCIGFATSPDLYDWTLQDPVYTGSFGELEVPQVWEHAGRWYCLFCTGPRFWSDAAKASLGAPVGGGHYLMADDPRGPWHLAPGPFLDTKRYAPRIVETDAGPKLLGFVMPGPGEDFPGVISDPVRVGYTADGRLELMREDG